MNKHLSIQEERKAAEYEYSVFAHNYPDAPIGSRDWSLYWAGWLARSTAHLRRELASQEQPK